MQDSKTVTFITNAFKKIASRRERIFAIILFQTIASPEKSAFYFLLNSCKCHARLPPCKKSNRLQQNKYRLRPVCPVQYRMKKNIAQLPVHLIKLALVCISLLQFLLFIIKFLLFTEEAYLLY